MQVVRLGVADLGCARQTFALMAEVFGDPASVTAESYTLALLERADVWVYAALDGGEPVGGLVAYALPLTRTPREELLVYDLAVRADRQRRGVGRTLLRQVVADAGAAGIAEVWVPADDEDVHALDFYQHTGGAPQAVTVFTYRTP